jgi:hypothetical protein
VFGYSALLYGIYLFIAGIRFSANIRLHQFGEQPESLSLENVLMAT